MSAELPRVSQVMYLCEGEADPGDEARAERLEWKLANFERDVARVVKEEPASSREGIASDTVDVENKLEGYWCKGEKCLSSRTRWVLHFSETICCDCGHDPCACGAPLVWDEAEQAYHHFFLSCDGKTKSNFWLSEPTSDRARIAFKHKEKKKRQHERKERRGRVRRQSTDCPERRVLLPPPCEEIETERRKRKTMHGTSESGWAGSLHSL
jgi:hypothetical protein